MKKIVSYFNSVFANHSVNHNRDIDSINFWCPTGMSPIVENQIKEYRNWLNNTNVQQSPCKSSINPQVIELWKRFLKRPTRVITIKAIWESTICVQPVWFLYSITRSIQKKRVNDKHRRSLGFETSWQSNRIYIQEFIENVFYG